MSILPYPADREPPVVTAEQSMKIFENRMRALAPEVVRLHREHTIDLITDGALHEFSRRVDTPFAGFENIAIEARMLVQSTIAAMMSEFFILSNPRHEQTLFNNLSAICFQCLKGHIGGLLMNGVV